MTPLSKLQKADIARAARRAYDVWPEREAFEAINSELSRSKCFEAWRHVESGKACGVQSLRAATQAHYGRLMAHFQALAGHAEQAARTRARDADNDRRIARFKLDQALRERGLQVGYAAAICRAKYKCPLDEASEKQLWKLVFDIRGRRKTAPKPKAPANDNPF
jgi:hypothetical protein